MHLYHFLIIFWQAHVGFYDGQYAPVAVDFKFGSHGHVDPNCGRCRRRTVSSKNLIPLVFNRC
jgi:hypothetical protein